jgi:formate-dependent nitrite reductase cytochrome c552 subunit
LNCHQARTVDPELDPSTPNAMVEITSYRYGPHHGPQGNMINGTGGYEIGSGYSNSAHANIENTCVTCHMADAFGDQAGGHTWNMSYVYHGHSELNTAGCVDCHENTDDLGTLAEEKAEELEELMDQLATILISQGVMDSTFYAVETDMSMNQAGGIYNYKFVEEDLSGGMHNFNYAKKLLENSIESLQ